MKIKVILERVYEVNYDFEDLDIEGIESISDMEDLEVIEDNYRECTTSLVHIELIPDDSESTESA